MKHRFVALFLSILLAFPMVQAGRAEGHESAEEQINDLLNSGFSMDDIVEIIQKTEPWAQYGDGLLTVTYRSIVLEMQERGLLLDSEVQQSKDIEKEVVVPQGTYTVGTDIPAGTYTISARTAGYIFIQVRSSTGEPLVANVLYNIYGQEFTNKIGKLTLSDGETIDISSGTVVFTPFKGLDF